MDGSQAKEGSTKGREFVSSGLERPHEAIKVTGGQQGRINVDVDNENRPFGSETYGRTSQVLRIGGAVAEEQWGQQQSIIFLDNSD